MAQSVESVAVVEVPERPALAPGVELVGELTGVSFAERQWLVQRDGQYLQFTELLYRVAEQIDGSRTLDEIAEAVTEASDWAVSGEQIGQLIAARLVPAGLIASESGDAPSVDLPRPDISPLNLTFRKQVAGPRGVEFFARVFQYLFTPLLLIPLLIGIALAHAWLYLDHGLNGALRDAIYSPGILLIVIGLTFITDAFHELGHAAALRYSGGRARGMGVGIYLVYPAYFTDTTDAYRLGRWGRVRTDLGGVYFELIVVLGAVALYAVTGQEVLLLLVLLINVGMIDNLLPFVRFDGYWALTDLTGIPDFFSQTRAFLRSLRHRPGVALPPLKPWAKVAFGTYLIVTIPALAVLTYFLFRSLPWTLTTTWDSMRQQIDAFSAAWANADLKNSAIAAGQILLLTLPLMGIAYLLYSLIWRPIRALWRWAGSRRPVANERAWAR
jgi:putative peptide zinc metalloprotease protein